jgi:predicted kinase
MLAGPPASGKSTHAAAILADPAFENAGLLSTDHYVELAARVSGRPYSEVFSSQIKSATQFLQRDLEAVLRQGRSAVWDQTNLTPGIRAKKIKRFPEEYTKICLYFEVDTDTLVARNSTRGGRAIPEDVLLDMVSSWQRPALEEGFDHVAVVQ